MNESTGKVIAAQFAECNTKEETDCLLKILNADYWPIINANKRARTDRLKEIRKAELAPFHEMACRWERGQKVFFAKGIESHDMDWNFNFVRGSEKKIKAGDWCRVWGYQPKAKRLWLCRPGDPCLYTNIIRSSFSVRDIMEHGISRTELAIRK